MARGWKYIALPRIIARRSRRRSIQAQRLKITHESVIVSGGARVIQAGREGGGVRSRELEGQLQKQSRAYGKSSGRDSLDRKRSRSVTSWGRQESSDLWLGHSISASRTAGRRMGRSAARIRSLPERRGEAPLFFDDSDHSLPRDAAYWMGVAEEE